MGLLRLLNRLFGSTEAIAKEIKLDDEAILNAWNDYIKTIPKKEAVIQKLAHDANLKPYLNELKLLLTTELTGISGEKKDESELISDLEAIGHSKRIKRVRRLKQCLWDAKIEYGHVHALLHQLHSCLKHEIHIVNTLSGSPKNAEKLILHLKSQLELELEVITQVKAIEQIHKFHKLFLALVKGEHVIRIMDSKEKKLLKRMQKRMGKIFSHEINEGLTYEWVIEVYNVVQDIFTDHEALMERGFMPHEKVDFEFVNRPEFVDLARGTILHLGKKKVSEQMINVFVHIFREWYNNEKD